MEFSSVRYLLSKRTVDDRALNRNVVDALRSSLAARGRGRMRVLELGAGVGTMVRRAVEWGLLREADYTLLDVDAESLTRVREVVAQWGRDRGATIGDGPDGSTTIEGPDCSLRIQTLRTDLESFLQHDDRRRYDLLVANAFLDLVDVPSVLPSLWARLDRDAHYWFSINFDGETILLPEHPLDSHVMALYHRSMDERVRGGKPAGDSKSGRHMFAHLNAVGADIAAAGASDWVVYPSNGSYPDDEAYFLAHIVETIRTALAEHPEIDRGAFASWTELRRAQIDRGELVYVAHQLDFTGKAHGAR